MMLCPLHKKCSEFDKHLFSKCHYVDEWMKCMALKYLKSQLPEKEVKLIEEKLNKMIIAYP